MGQTSSFMMTTNDILKAQTSSEYNWYNKWTHLDADGIPYKTIKEGLKQPDCIKVSCILNRKDYTGQVVPNQAWLYQNTSGFQFHASRFQSKDSHTNPWRQAQKWQHTHCVDEVVLSRCRSHRVDCRSHKMLPRRKGPHKGCWVPEGTSVKVYRDK